MNLKELFYLNSAIHVIEGYMTDPKFDNWVDMHLGLQQLRQEIKKEIELAHAREEKNA